MVIFKRFCGDTTMVGRRPTETAAIVVWTRSSCNRNRNWCYSRWKWGEIIGRWLVLSGSKEYKIASSQYYLNDFSRKLADPRRNSTTNKNFLSDISRSDLTNILLFLHHVIYVSLMHFPFLQVSWKYYHVLWNSSSIKAHLKFLDPQKMKK